MWARHDLRTREGAETWLEHPQVGMVHLRREKLALSGVPGLMLVAYHAAPGSPDAEKLQLLGSLADSSTPSGADARQARDAFRP